MRLTLALLVILGLGAFAYTRFAPRFALPEPAPESAREAPLDLPEGGARLTLVQRHDAEVPGSGGRLRVHIGDITRGQVELTLARADGSTVVAPTSVREGDHLPFRVGETRYDLAVVELKNKLLGDDTATLEFCAGVSESARIEALLAAMEHAEGLVFIRNGKEYDGAEAAAHLRRKWDATKDRVRTAEQFIEYLATKSSMSGKPYEIRLGDGTVVPAADWLTERLDEAPREH